MNLLLILASLSLAQAASVPSQPVVVKRVAPAAAWAKLRMRVLKKPDSNQNAQLNGGDYRILAVFTSDAIGRQECPAGTQPKNAVYFTVPASGKAQPQDVYPVRLTLGCVQSPDGAPAHDLLSIDADMDGNILDISLWDSSLGILVHPTAEPVPVPGDTQTSNLETVLERLVKALTVAP